MDEKPPPDWLRDLPTRSEDVGYSPEELRQCEACGKPNAPNRSGCLYCGAEFIGASPRLQIREVESWENGYNVVLIHAGTGDKDHASGVLASTLGVERATLLQILRSGKPLPVARVESDTVATAVAGSLGELGLTAIVVADDKLAAASAQVRLRSIEFRGDAISLTLFNSDETLRLDRSELALIVTGVIHELRTEAMEKRKRGESRTISESQTAQDQPFIDIYSRHDPAGWRIPASGFDFSCLGDRKSLLAAENLERLVSRLIEFAPDAKLVEDYLAVRPLLETVWPSEHRREAFGFQRSGFGRKDLSSLRTSSNLTQVNKYSRLQWHLL